MTIKNILFAALSAAFFLVGSHLEYTDQKHTETHKQCEWVKVQGGSYESCVEGKKNVR